MLLLNNFFEEGSTGKIILDIKNELDRNRIENIVCYGRGKNYFYNDKSIIRICSNLYAKFCKLLCCITGIKFDWCYLSTYRLIRIIKKEKPDIVHLHCINDNIVNIYGLITYLKKNNIKTIITLHAEFLYTANCGYSLACEKWKTGCGLCPRVKQEIHSFFFDRTHKSWKKMQSAFNGFDKNLWLVSVSPWLYQRVEESTILSGKKHSVILNGIDTDKYFHYCKSEVRKKLRLDDNKKIILHVTASFSRPIKGGKYVLEIARQMPDLVFIIIGNDNHDIQFSSNVIDLGIINDQKKLSEYYSAADLLLITSEKETFCMPVAESLCCGTPVVGFKAGAPEEIAINDYSSFVEFGKSDLLKNEIRKWLMVNIDKIEVSKESKKKYSKEKMSKLYIELYENVILSGGSSFDAKSR